jgi:hypothetical protein
MFSCTYLSKLFIQCEMVARELQRVGIRAVAATESISLLTTTLEKLRTDVEIERLLQMVDSAVTLLHLKVPKLGRPSHTPLRYRQTAAEEELSNSTHVMWRRAFFEAIDVVVTELKQRFDQPGMKIACARERLLVAAAKQSPVEIQPSPLDLPPCFNEKRLTIQLSILSDLCENKYVETVADVAAVLAFMQRETRRVSNEVEKLISLVLCLPISVAGSERAFSFLRILKTWLRSTSTQERLTHLGLMKAHRNILDEIEILELMREFISKTPERVCVFGKI